MTKIVDDPILPEQAERLRDARIKRGFDNAKAAADFFGWNYTTYSQHERGERGLARTAGRYAAALRVSAGWLLTGEGGMDLARINVHGRIGAGAIVTMDDDGDELAKSLSVDLPDASNCWAFVVQGDSMRPRFYANEVVVFDLSPSPEEELIGQDCLAQILSTGDRYVKILRRGGGADRWRLEAHNADPMENVELTAVYRWRATLPPRDGRGTVIPPLPAKRRR